MRAVLLCFIVAIGVTLAADQRVQNNEDESIRAKRVLLSSTQTTLISNGFDVTSHLVDKMAAQNFGGVLGDVAGAASSFLGAIGPFVGLFLNLLAGPSQVSQQLKTLYNRVDSGFKRVDVQFGQLKNEVHFIPTAVQFNQLESNINALYGKLTALSKTTSAATYRSAVSTFQHAYGDGTYAGAGVKLYNAINQGGLISGGIFNEFMTHKDNDRKQTQRFMLGTLGLLLKAAAVDIAHSQLSHSANLHTDVSTWKTRIGNIKTKMQHLDDSIVRNYHTQMTKDINDFGTLKPKSSLGNRDFAHQLYDKLSKKFFWRDWLVLASNPYDHRHMVTHACEYDQHSYGGRTIQVASVDKTHRHNGNQFTLSSYHLKLYITSAARPGSHDHYRYTCVDCNTAWGQMPASKTQCSTYAAAGVVCMKSTDITIVGASGRYHSYNPHGANLAFIFG